MKVYFLWCLLPSPGKIVQGVKFECNIRPFLLYKIYIKLNKKINGGSCICALPKPNIKSAYDYYKKNYKIK